MDIYKLNKIRPYVNFGLLKLFRLKTFFFMCKFPKIVSNLKNIYEFQCRVLGVKTSNSIIKHMYCDFLTGGSTYEELETSVKRMEDEGIFSSIAYCREFLTKKEENV